MTDNPNGWTVDVDGVNVVMALPEGRASGRQVLSRYEVRVLREQLRLAYLLAGRNRWATGRDVAANELAEEVPRGSALTHDELSLREVEVSDEIAAKLLERYNTFVERYVNRALRGVRYGEASAKASPRSAASWEVPVNVPRDWRIAAKGQSVEFAVPASAADGEFVLGIDEAVAAGVALIQQAERALIAQQEGNRTAGDDQ